MKKIMISGLLLLTVLLINGDIHAIDAQNEKTQTIKQPEQDLNVKVLDTMDTQIITYTEKNINRVASGNVNNVAVQVEEYYNENKDEYSYVLTASDNNVSTTYLNYSIIQISVAANPDESRGIYTLNTSSALPINEMMLDFTQDEFFLFTSNESLFNQNFVIELILTNAEPYDDYEVNHQTFRFNVISKSGGSSMLLTE